MTTQKLRVLPFAHNVRVGSFRVDQLPLLAYWLTQQLLFPPRCDREAAQKRRFVFADVSGVRRAFCAHWLVCLYE